MAKVPRQKPHCSKQDYGTPPELLTAIRNRLRIDEFAVDLAASKDNAVCRCFYDESYDSLKRSRDWAVDGWAWLNPPFANITSWVSKALHESTNYGAHVVMLTPASPGSNWWRDYVEPYAYVSYLNGRFVFVGTPNNPKTGKPDVYPKDCALLFYTPWGFRGSEVWNWRRDLSQLQQSESGEDKGVHPVSELQL